ncbi:MAG: hypothetical protein Q9227_007848 [Pyrenula ochraceoflavens]
MVQAPMISSPLKQTNEIDWIEPLKGYIRSSYGDDPERYNEECATLNRLRQDMRGAGRDSAAGRDLLYRYYGQLELLDLRFPVDENHIKISFTWHDAFTLKPTSQYSLAYEKASIIFNISAVLSCHAANQNRSEENGLKTAYHSFQASAGMFTYINENFLHAPSADLSRDTVKTLINVTLAQAQEVFLEKQVADGKKPGLLAKLAAQAAYLHSQTAEGVQDNVSKGIFDRTWLTMTQIKAAHIGSLAEYYQALVDDESNAHGTCIARLQNADRLAKSASSMAKSFPSSVPPTSNLTSDTGPNLTTITRRHLEIVQEKLNASIKDNDFIYHQTVPAEAALAAVSKLPAAKAIPVSELYQGQDIQKIIGPDIFQRIVPMSVTESASLYDEEKAKLVRAEAEKVESANGEMAASLDYLKLPGSLNILKGGADQEMTVDEDFKRWCEDVSAHGPISPALDTIQTDKVYVMNLLDKSTKQLDMEESVCEKMRSKYGGDWTQQPSSRLTSTLRSDVRSYRGTIDEASSSDAQLMATARQYETDFDDMRNAGEADEADVLFQQALIKAGGARKQASSSEQNLLDEDYSGSGPSIADQIARVEEILRKLNLLKRERGQVLKDLKERVHTDDISSVLILNKKSMALANHENQLFQAELEKFRPHQNRLLSTVHKQSSLLKELTKTYGELLQDKRVQADRQKYENVTRSRSTAMSKYRKVMGAFEDLTQGLVRAQNFYSDMKESVESLEKNVDGFVNNRRAEGAQLLSHIEQNKSNSVGGQASLERERLQQLMERMSMDPSPSPSRPQPYTSGSFSKSPPSPHYPPTNPDPRFTIPPRNSPQPPTQHDFLPPSSQPYQTASGFSQGAAAPLSEGYNPMAYPYPMGHPHSHSPAPQNYMSPTSHTPTPAQFLPPQQPQSQPQNQAPSPTHRQLAFQPPRNQSYSQGWQQQYPPQQYTGMPGGYVPPPPPPGPPPSQSETQYPPNAGPWPSGPGGYAQGNRSQQPAPNGDPWAGLSAWK